MESESLEVAIEVEEEEVLGLLMMLLDSLRVWVEKQDEVIERNEWIEMELLPLKSVDALLLVRKDKEARMGNSK